MKFLDIQILTYRPERYYVFGSYEFVWGNDLTQQPTLFLSLRSRRSCSLALFGVLNLIQGSVHPIASLLVRLAFRSSICRFFIASKRVKLGPSKKKYLAKHLIDVQIGYPVILRILGFFSSSFSRKIQHPWLQIAPPISQSSWSSLWMSSTGLSTKIRVFWGPETWQIETFGPICSHATFCSVPCSSSLHE